MVTKAKTNPGGWNRIVLLGPQRRKPTLAEAVAEHIGPRGMLAAITAGWEEREDEDQELSDHLGGRVRNLRIHARVEQIFERDPKLFEAMQRRHHRLRYLQDLYRRRLGHMLDSAREFMRLEDPEDEGEKLLLDEQREDAMGAIRRLDEQHLAAIAGVHARFRENHRIPDRKSIVHHKEELRTILGDAAGLCIAGGHVAVLLNRVRLFDLLELWPDRPLFAWSAGAMILADRTVVFHDTPPQGPGNAEVLEVGLGAFHGVIPLPHARKRLKLDDPLRVKLFARRFAPHACIALDDETGVTWNGKRWIGRAGTEILTVDGTLDPARKR